MARTLPPTTRTTMQEQPSASGAPSAPPFATVMLCPSEDDQEKAARARSASLSIRGERLRRRQDRAAGTTRSRRASSASCTTPATRSWASSSRGSAKRAGGRQAACTRRRRQPQARVAADAFRGTAGSRAQALPVPEDERSRPAGHRQPADHRFEAERPNQRWMGDVTEIRPALRWTSDPRRPHNSPLRKRFERRFSSRVSSCIDLDIEAGSVHRWRRLAR